MYVTPDLSYDYVRREEDKEGRKDKFVHGMATTKQLNNKNANGMDTTNHNTHKNGYDKPQHIQDRKPGTR